jgi:hypothetical protein
MPQPHHLKQSSPTLGGEPTLTNPSSSTQGNTPLDHNWNTTTTNNSNNNNNNVFYPPGSANSNHLASYDPSLRKMSLAELALSTCDGASCTNWTVGDNRENVAAALQSLMGRGGNSYGGNVNGLMNNQSMFDLNSASSVPVSNPSIDTLAFNLGFSNMDPYNTSSEP